MEKKSYVKITIEAPGCEAKVSLGKIRSSIMAQSLSAER